MATRRTATSDDQRRALLTLLPAARAVVVVIAIAALLGGIAVVVGDRKAVGFTIGGGALGAAVVACSFLSYLQWRVTVADERAAAAATIDAPPAAVVRPED